eukprot:scaffold15104_cov31-Tisochrysis_lutea.AAC.2
MPFASVLHDRFLGAVARGRGQLDWSAIALSVSEDAGVKVEPQGVEKRPACEPFGAGRASTGSSCSPEAKRRRKTGEGSARRGWGFRRHPNIGGPCCMQQASSYVQWWQEHSREGHCECHAKCSRLARQTAARRFAVVLLPFPPSSSVVCRRLRPLLVIVTAGCMRGLGAHRSSLVARLHVCG